MNSPEHVFALFVEANPVPDSVAALEDPGAAQSYLSVVSPTRPSTMPDHRKEPPHRIMRKRWRATAMAAVLALLAVAVSYTALVLSRPASGPVAAEHAAMRVVFDGSACAYSGPASLTAGRGVITVERLAGVEPVAFLVAPMTRDSTTLDDVVSWSADHSAQDIPPFVRWPWSQVVIAEPAPSRRWP